MKNNILKIAFLLGGFIITSALFSDTSRASANNETEENAIALFNTIEENGPLCRGQLFKNCKENTEKTCVFSISPSKSCTFKGFEKKETGSQNPN